MAAKTAKSGLYAKLGGKLKTAVAAHKADETEYGRGGDLPPGINGGVAKLNEAKFSQYKKGKNKGEYFFYASGVCVSPVEFEGRRTEGCITSIMIPMCAQTYNDGTVVGIEDQVARLLNELRKLGIDTSEMGDEDLEEAAASLKDSAPYFQFRTWAKDKEPGKPAPITNHVWEKAIQDYVGDGEAGDDVVDESGGEATIEGSKMADDDWVGLAGLADNNDDKDAATKLSDKAEELGIDANELPNWEEVATAIIEAEANAGNEDDSEGAETSWQELGEMADNESGKKSDDAIEKLSEAATAAELDPDDYPSWGKLGEALDAATEGGDDEPEPYEPKKEDMVKYKPKGSKKAVDCEIVAVFAKNSTVNLKNVEDGRTVYKAVPFDQLIVE